MNSSFVAIATLVTSNLRERCLMNIFMSISNETLRYYLQCRKIYNRTSSKKKTELIEISGYGHNTDIISKMGLQDITKEEANQTLNKNKIKIKTLSGYVKMELKSKEILACTNNEPSIKLHD